MKSWKLVVCSFALLLISLTAYAQAPQAKSPHAKGPAQIAIDPSLAEIAHAYQQQTGNLIIQVSEKSPLCPPTLHFCMCAGANSCLSMITSKVCKTGSVQCTGGKAPVCSCDNNKN